jgi:hypothetical protein
MIIAIGKESWDKLREMAAERLRWKGNWFPL